VKPAERLSADLDLFPTGKRGKKKRKRFGQKKKPIMLVKMDVLPFREKRGHGIRNGRYGPPGRLKNERRSRGGKP